ncbi:hypothetical protein M407DRAFT_245165 [Tulasnella calospora MUT 4182]|uniref:Uncharacterized protein n=1 Tax=Tulasnella calospora MUT 4182 TaxID=1051891 RepID=A0A0C3Q251_9AGAM|nr:hypothetical protein M407DRAFT_245165 [Tulasnella calospora MUT 4182]
MPCFAFLIRDEAYPVPQTSVRKNLPNRNNSRSLAVSYTSLFVPTIPLCRRISKQRIRYA